MWGRPKGHVAAPRKPPFYQFVYGNQIPTAGAMAYGFESEMLAWRPAIGPAIAFRTQLTSIFPYAQAAQGTSVAWLTGLTGIVHGQTALQPLSNPYGTRGQ